MLQTDLPFFEGPEDALRSAVQALGGAKVVGARLWPDKAPDAAARLMLDALNPGRHEKLELSQVLLVLRLAHAAGHHGAMRWLAAEAGYEATALSSHVEVDRAAKAVEQAARALTSAVAALERMQGAANPPRSA